MSKDKTFGQKLRKAFAAVAFPLAALGIVAGGTAGYELGTRQHMRVTVEDTTWSLLQKGEGFGFTKTVYKTDKGELTNTLSYINGKFSRAAIKDEIKVGKTYDVTTVGFSVPFFGVYPNIIKATPVNPPGR
ncbi:MAG: hypothetical protein GC185_13540 [Alphaproteobacteria bacterium]|nr:hypothetical protein [Alphaproteobacteria bacterium]